MKECCGKWREGAFTIYDDLKNGNPRKILHCPECGEKYKKKVKKWLTVVVKESVKTYAGYITDEKPDTKGIHQQEIEFEE